MASKEFQNWTDEQIGFQAKRQLYEGDYSRLTIKDAKAEIEEYLKLTPEEKDVKKAQESQRAREWGKATRIHMSRIEMWPPEPESSQIEMDRFK
jgi:hypothetical protein